VPKNKALYHILDDTHVVLAWTLGSVAVVHLGAALRHHFMLKDDVLRRMLPMRLTKTPEQR
jgi:cytochrome b561